MYPTELQIQALQAAIDREEDPERRESLHDTLAILLARGTRSMRAVPAAETRSR